MTRVTLDNKLEVELNESNQTAKVVESPNASGDIVVPRYVEHQNKKYDIKSIEECAFADNSKINSISFAADSVVSVIGGSAFLECSIVSLSLPASIENLAVDFPYLARNLVNLEVPSNIKNYKYVDGTYLLGKSNGDDFDTLRFVRRNFEGKFVIPSGIKSINNSAFCSCTKITSVEFQSPCTIERFDMNAFLECSGLQNIQDIPASVVEVDDRCFMDVTTLQSIKFLGENVTLGDCCFYQCYQLQKVSFPNGKHIKIGIDAFHDHPDNFKVESPPGIDIEYRQPVGSDSDSD